MLTRLRIRNFKRFDDVDVELGEAVVFIGPNNSGKTTALQALALWETGLRRWNEKRRGKPSPEKRSGVTINRRDLISIPVPDANLLWRALHVRNVEPTKKPDGKPSSKTQNIRVDIIVDGISDGTKWTCGLEFDYANDESFYCRPLRQSDNPNNPERMPVPEQAASARVAYLPPMSGLADREFLKQPGEVGVLIGQGQTAQVLRNLCFRVFAPTQTDSDEPASDWNALCTQIKDLFGVELQAPQLIPERSEIVMSYRDTDGTILDLSSSGRGLQQTLLLLAHLYANPNTTLLLDEPDAHLEILRQRQIYTLLTKVASERGCQVIAASHSEVVLDEAARNDMVIAFVGKPHRIDRQASQVLKALKDVQFDSYYKAEQTGWILYLENSTDLAILQEFAKLLDHSAGDVLACPFVHFVETNLPQRARDHFYALREAKPDLVGIAIFDRLERELQQDGHLREIMWSRREIENYFCSESVLVEFAGSGLSDDLIDTMTRDTRTQAMRDAIESVSSALATLGKPSPYSADIKASDEFLDPVFQDYSKRLDLPLQLRKATYFRLVSHARPEELSEEVNHVLDLVLSTAQLARPGSRAGRVSSL